jgi:hypothetical protein
MESHVSWLLIVKNDYIGFYIWIYEKIRSKCHNEIEIGCKKDILKLPKSFV